MIPPSVHINILLRAGLGVPSNDIAQASLASTAVLYTLGVVLHITDLAVTISERTNRIFKNATLLLSPVLVLQIDVAVVDRAHHALGVALFDRAVWDQPFLGEFVDGHYVVVTAHVEVVFFHIVERTTKTTGLVF